MFVMVAEGVGGAVTVCVAVAEGVGDGLTVLLMLGVDVSVVDGVGTDDDGVVVPGVGDPVAVAV